MNTMSTKEMLHFASIEYPLIIKEQWLKDLYPNSEEEAEKLNLVVEEYLQVMWFEYCSRNELPECYLDV